MKALLHPARAVALVFLAAILAGTVLLMLPAAHAEGISAPWTTAFFTAVSAVCVTGLVVVDTGTYWSSFGQAVILVLFQLGGFGMMTVATLLGLLVNRSFRLHTKLIAQAESRSLGLGSISSVARLVLVVTFALELAVTLLLTLRLHQAYGLSWGEAAWSGLFHAVSAFNNAGFSIHAASLMGYATDALILLPIMAAIVIGGIGFPVLSDLRNRFRAPATGRCTPSSPCPAAASCCSAAFRACFCSSGRTRRPWGPWRCRTSCFPRSSPRFRRVRPGSIRSISARSPRRAGRCITS
ncbi:potassium transporter TrkG [Azotobacter salinestris]|uniref:potassium transporter TrkG n=1 Tax=Azotobacter salinestris TaxID=69964 RepID=UPI003D7F50CF